MMQYQETDHKSRFFRAGALLEDSAISDVGFKYRVPQFRCEVCGAESYAFHLGYPHLNPAEVLGKDELTLLDETKTPGKDQILHCVKRLEAHFGVFVSAGSYFGPIRIKVARKLKFDFDILPFTFDFFATRKAAEALRTEGFDFDFVSPDASGKNSKDADFVQMIVPIAAYGSLPEGGSFCYVCKRKSGPRMPTGYVPVLYEAPAIHRLPFFKIYNSCYLVLSASFVDASARLGLKGLTEGKTIFPMPVVADPEPSRPRLSWQRPTGLGTAKPTASKEKVSGS